MDGNELWVDGLRHAIRIRIATASRETGYLPEGYLEAIRQPDPAAGLRALLYGEAHEDSIQLWARGRLDLTVESFVLTPPWCECFTPEDRRKADDRLRDWNSIDPMESVAALVERSLHPFYGAEDTDWGE